MGKEKPVHIYRVGMAWWKRTRIDSGWSREGLRNLNVKATSRGDAVEKATKTVGYEYLPPAQGSKGRYFLLFCGRYYYVCRALGPRQARAYVADALRRRHAEQDLGESVVLSSSPRRPFYSVWPISVIRQRPAEERIEAGLPPLRVSLPPEPLVCEWCGYEDPFRGSDASDPCCNCGKRPRTDDEVLEEIFLQHTMPDPPLVTVPLSPPPP